MIPRATYRLQFHKAFTFADAAPLAPYLARMGISHVYASPIGTARAGSAHGYDQIDPTRISPELGGEAGFRALAAALRHEGLGLILDIVPNHMAVGQADNRWWLDVLARGPDSEYAQMFDIDWVPADPALQGKIHAPFLGAPYAEALAGGDLKLERDERTGVLSIWAYGAHRFPLRPEDKNIVAPGGDLARFDAADIDGRARLHALLEGQHYRLASWRTAGDEINWRRFFDITELAAIRVERGEVFDLIHALPLRLYGEGLIDGVRVDHVDGLADPAGYCRKLRGALEAAATRRPPGANPGPAYLVVEKILAQGEALPPDWLTDGTTGYDYMNESAALLHDPAGEAELTRLWREISGRPDFEDEERQARLETLRRLFSGQLEATVRAFHQVARSELATRDLTAGMLRRALTNLLSVFPAYRSYGVAGVATPSDAPLLKRALERASPLMAPGEAEVLTRVAAWLAGEGPGDLNARRTAVRRFQQLSAPIAAKAVEDTAFYRDARLLSRADVGSDPARLAGSVAQMHAANAQRAASLPHAMLATATHDHKRGEDVRGRLAVLSERPRRWSEAVARWSLLTAQLNRGLDPADLYPLYQTLVGAWPLELTVEDRDGVAAYRDRVGGWWRKAVREAKLNSSWAAPDAAYEDRCVGFLDAALDPDRCAGFLRDLSGFANEIAPAGAVNGLVQALLRCTVPGVPDLYQGAEGWDFSLVDPDNRRPVDWSWRMAAAAAPTSLADLMASWRDGRVKQAIIARALDAKKRSAVLFSTAAYVPLDIEGEGPGRIIAFLRTSGSDAVLCAATLGGGEALSSGDLTLATNWWGQRRLALPKALTSRRWKDLLFEERLELAEKPLLKDIFMRKPFALLQLVADG